MPALVCYEAHGYWHGATALNKWAEDLGRYDTLTDADQGSLFTVNWWNYESLVDARLHAASFIRKAIQWFPRPGQAHLDRAAAIYESEAQRLRSAMYGGEVFPGPWTGKTIAHWTPDVRKAEQELLICATEDEGDALGHMEGALATLPPKA